MANDVTELVVIFDFSRQVGCAKQKRLDALIKTIEEQRHCGGKTLVTLYFIDANWLALNLYYREPLENIEINDRIICLLSVFRNRDRCKKYSDRFLLGGLYGCTDETIDEIDAMHKAMKKDEVPQKTKFVIIAEGLYEWYRDRLHLGAKWLSILVKKINKYKSKGWQFLFPVESFHKAFTVFKKTSPSMLEELKIMEYGY